MHGAPDGVSMYPPTMLNEADKITTDVVNGGRPGFIMGLLLANPMFETNAEFDFIDLRHHVPFR